MPRYGLNIARVAVKHQSINQSITVELVYHIFHEVHLHVSKCPFSNLLFCSSNIETCDKRLQRKTQKNNYEK